MNRPVPNPAPPAPKDRDDPDVHGVARFAAQVIVVALCLIGVGLVCTAIAGLPWLVMLFF